MDYLKRKCVICNESREWVEKNLIRWRYMLKKGGMKICRSKTENMCLNETGVTVKMQEAEV